MRETLRLSLTLAFIAILSAALLTGVHGVTEPVIRERQDREYTEALEEYFPAFASYETKRVGNNYYDLIYDDAGELVGFMGTVQVQGYDGAITYNLAVNAEGEIVGLRIISHSETPGLGDVITTDSFINQFVGKNYDDPLEAGGDVDTVSGATISTEAMIISVRSAIREIAAEFLGRGPDAFDLSVVADGTYRGSVEGTSGVLEVEVTMLDGRIEAIEIIEQNETDAYFVEAYPLIPERIIEEQRLEVETQTGATISAERIVSAVREALSSPPLESVGGEESVEAE